MKIYLTVGTEDYLQWIKESHPAETLLLMKTEEDSALLLHETEHESLFNEGRNYEVLEKVGTMEEARFAVMNNIPVSDEGRPLFEYRFKNRARLIENEPGFIALRVLRPINNDTYIILTLWKSENDFLNWKNSTAYDHAHKKSGTNTGLDQQSIFPKPAYVTKYNISSN